MDMTGSQTCITHNGHSAAVSPKQLLQVLYIDSDENDLILTQLGCEHLGAPFRFVLAPSVDEAIFGLISAQASDGWLPDLILLEIMSERQRGFEVLEFLRSQPALMDIPVVAFTATIDPVLLAKARALGAKWLLKKQSSTQAAKDLLELTVAAELGR